jgi:hypothetical protein
MDGIQEQPAGALTQIGAAQVGKPDPAMNPQGALQNFALAQAEKKQSYLEKVQDAYNRDMNQYAQMVEQSRQPEASEAGRWGSIAQGFSSVAPTWGNTGAMLGKGGAEYGKFVDQTQQQDLKNQGDLTKTRQAEVRALESKDQSAAMMKQLYGQNKGFEPRKNSDGTTTVYDKNTGLPVGTYGPQDIGKLTQLTQTLAKAAVEKGEYATLDEATHWAHTEALRLIEDANRRMGNRTKPLAGDVGGVPTTDQPAAEVSTPQPEAVGKALAEETSAGHEDNIAALKNHIASLPPEARAEVERNFQRYIARPNAGTLKGVESALTRSNAMPKKDIPGAEARKETAGASAKTYEGLFADNVAKPAEAFANTGKIMQDFNVLGQMNYALKNGKLKEFMGGETGKYALSFLPENSDLRKGIANAQEAEKLTAGMVNQILMAAKGVQTEGDAQRARSQVTSIGSDPDANAYLEAYIMETARQLKMREKVGLAHKNTTGTFEGYSDAWSNSPLMKEAKGSVKKLGSQWIGATQYIDKFKAKNPGATDSDAVQSWNRVK